MKLHITLLIALVAASFSGMAQDPSQFRYFEMNEASDINGIRAAIEAVKDLDPYGEVHYYNDEMTIIQVRVNPSVTDTELRQGITANGIQLRAEAPVITPQQPVYTKPDGKPMYVVTGNTEADRTRYEEAVHEWNSSNPTDPMELPLPIGEDQ